MYVVHVFAHVKPERIEAFKQATLENARSSVRESGIARFDVLQQQDDPARFVLVEVYRSPDDPARHKETPHYAAWRDAVADMMAEPRTSVRYDNVFPDDTGWDSPYEV
jgi:(4S)-4-hydroxy-5-phosphonooxypentane-2,3-dione isomerase